MTSFKSKLGIAALLGAIIIAPVVSFAQSERHGEQDSGSMGAAGMSADCGAMGVSGGMMALNAEALTKAETTLAISPNQRGEWNGFMDAVKASIDDASALHQSMDPKMMYQMSSSDMQEFMKGVLASRQDSLKQVSEARSKLFGVLTDDQKAKATQLFGDPDRGPCIMGNGMIGGGMMGHGMMGNGMMGNGMMSPKQ